MHKFFTNNTFFIFFKLDFFSLKKMEEKDIKEEQKDLLDIVFNQCKLHKLKGKILSDDAKMFTSEIHDPCVRMTGS